MLDTIGAFGSGIGTNLLSDSLSKKLEAFKDKKAIASFAQSLRDWEIEFEKQNDGTIITNGAFYSHVKYHRVSVWKEGAYWEKVSMDSTL